MGYPKKNSLITNSNISKVLTIISLYVNLSFVISCSVSLALHQPNVPFNSTRLFKFQPRNPSVGRNFIGDYGSESTGKLFRWTAHVNNANRVRRSSWNSSERNRETGHHDEGSTSQDTSPPNLYESSDKKELRRRHLYLLLAQQEAKCLQEFGELEPTASFDFAHDLFRPFVCLPGSQNYSACEQCIQITRAGTVGSTTFSSASCTNICRVLSALPDCTERCAEVIQFLIDGMKAPRNGAIAGDGELNVKGGCNKTKCRLKLTASEVNRPGIPTRGNYANTLMTNVFCESVTQPLLKTQTTSNSTLTSGLESQQKESNNRHFVYLKSLFVDDEGHETVDEREDPTVFVIEQREFEDNNLGSKREMEGNWTSWRVLGKSPYGFDKIQVAYRQQSYEWRVTAVGIHGPLGVSIVKSFDTLDGYMEPGPPTRVFVLESKPKESTVDVLLGWDPPQERACFYKIVLETRNEEESARAVRIKGEPLGVHKVWFPDLKFDSTYEVRITSRSAEWHEDESTHASLSFKTPACLDSHQFRFDQCAPPPPQNVSYKVSALSSSKVMDVLSSPVAPLKRHFTAHLKWNPPAHASAKNVIENYIVNVGVFSWNLHINNKNSSKHADSRSEFIDRQEALAPLQINLPGNVTEVTVDNLDESVEYTVLVSAVSSKGSSPPVALTIKFDSGVGFLNTSIGLWVYPCGLLVTVVMVAFGFHAMHGVKAISRRRQIKAARDSYFQSIDQRDAFTEDWCVVPLTENPTSSLKMLEENSFTKDKWHVSLQDLTIGDIIGQGAFGIVRKANLRREKYLELQRTRKGMALDTKYQVLSTKVGQDECEMETVALKMLRVAATKADKEDLMKELMTMQSLGMHPQIVTLLGVCTTPKSMCLVLEYCPGGDLLSFLRKFRETYLPLLNLEFGTMKGRWFENPKYKSSSYEDKLIRRISSGTGGDCQEVCYTDIHHDKEFSSSSRELPEENQAVAKQVTETDVPASSDDVTHECDSISEKDVLCYARQIALGMAYLERNHIIHRDLACRNVLVMGDHKRVKISDFGLSRDIYTWNVYQQKTDGKLPFKWMALESITSRVFTSKSDVWSYGIVLWELVTLGAVPYPALENQELFKMLRSGYRMERPDNCSEELYALMRKCWRTAPADRPNFLELISYLQTMMATEPELYLTFQP